MNKSELIEHVAKQSATDKATTRRVMMAVANSVTSTLKKGDSVSLPGVGTFSVSKPRASASKAKAARVAEFRPSNALKDAL